MKIGEGENRREENREKEEEKMDKGKDIIIRLIKNLMTESKILILQHFMISVS